LNQFETSGTFGKTMLAAKSVLGRALLVVIAALAFTGAAQAASNARLLAKFQPVTYFTSDELFRPTLVDSFIADSTLERFDGSGFVLVDPDPDPGSLPTFGLGWRLNQQPCTPATGLTGQDCYAASWGAHGDPSIVYGRVVRTGGKVVVQYWYFYYDDFYSYTSPASDFIWQAHEGDWEVVNVVLSDDEEPLFVGYSQHCLGQRRTWSKTPRWHGHHPVVYVARGSHANYLEPGLHMLETACLPGPVLDFFHATGLTLPADVTGDAASAGPVRFGSEATTVEQVSEGDPAWIDFPGTWGELQFFHAQGFGTAFSGQSPVGPAQHAVWISPLATLASWDVG
jgi:hypothetical protein